MGALSEVIDQPRSSWTTQGPVRPMRYLSSQRWTHLEVHHSGVPQGIRSASDMFRSAYRYHTETKQWQDIWYHLGINKAGEIIQLRGINASNSSRKFLTVLVPGLDSMNSLQLRAIHEIQIAMLSNGNPSANLTWHRENRPSICPGPNTIVELGAHRDLDIPHTPPNPPTNENLFDPPLNLEGVIGFAVDLEGRGSWVATKDGGVFTMGTQPFHGSAAGEGYNDGKMVSIEPYGDGYMLTDIHGHEYHYYSEAP